jgi:hypothetical protein
MFPHHLIPVSVVWFPNDPCAIYIEAQLPRCRATMINAQVGQRVFREVVAEQNGEREARERLNLGLLGQNVCTCYCLWGCTHAPKHSNGALTSLSFASETDLWQHYDEVHNFGGASVHFSPLVHFIRVSDAGEVEKVISHLLSAACVYSAKLAMKAKTTMAAESVFDPSSGDTIICSPSRYRLSLSFESLIEAFRGGPRAAEPLFRSNPLHQITHLLTKIKFLFEVRQGSSVGLATGTLKGLRRLEANERAWDPVSSPYKSMCSHQDPCSPL